MRTIRHTALRQLLESSEPIEILDLRPRQEFMRRHAEGAHCLPAGELCPEKLLAARELLPTEPLYLISRSGALAQLTAQDLERQGFDNMVVVAGGMQSWEQNHLPVTSQ